MPSLDVQRLWKLHKIDSGLVDIRNQAASLDPGKATRAEIEKLKAEDAEIGGRYRTLNQEMLDLDLLQKGTDDKIKKVEKELYGGLIVSARESEAYQKEIAGLKKHKEDRDERLLELYELIPPAKAAADVIHEQIEKKRLELGDANKKAQAMKLELEREFARLTKLRPEAAKIVNPALLARYDSIRQRHNGVGMAEVTKKGSCSGCGTGQPERTLQALREDKVATCESCHRILYHTEGVI
jgi:predicted  nucleic acid-binding Zn-ribbon protein